MHLFAVVGAVAVVAIVLLAAAVLAGALFVYRAVTQ